MRKVLQYIAAVVISATPLLLLGYALPVGQTSSVSAATGISTWVQQHCAQSFAVNETGWWIFHEIRYAYVNDYYICPSKDSSVICTHLFSDHQLSYDEHTTSSCQYKDNSNFIKGFLNTLDTADVRSINDLVTFFGGSACSTIGTTGMPSCADYNPFSNNNKITRPGDPANPTIPIPGDPNGNTQPVDPNNTPNTPNSPIATCPDTLFFQGICDETQIGYGITGLIVMILNWALVGVGTVVTIMVVIGGGIYMTAAGSQERAKQGIKIIRNALLGLVLYLIMLSALNFLVPGGIFT